MKKNIKRNNLSIVIIFWVGVLECAFFVSPAYGAPSIEKKIKNHSTVSYVKIIMDQGFIFNKRLTLFIKFIDGGEIAVENINGQGRGAIGGKEAIRIFHVDGYFIYSTNTPSPELLMKFWSVIAGVQLKDVMDIVENHYAIRQAVNEWPIIDDTEDESSIDIERRLKAENNIPFIIFEGKKYWLHKSSWNYSGWLEAGRFVK